LVDDVTRTGALPALADQPAREGLDRKVAGAEVERDRLLPALRSHLEKGEIEEAAGVADQQVESRGPGERGLDQGRGSLRGREIGDETVLERGRLMGVKENGAPAD
jgi:hypothetical protein